MQELDEQVPCLFRLLVPVVTVTAWQMDRERINASLQDIGSGNGSFEAARGNPCSDSESFAQRVAHPYDELGDVHSVGHLGQGPTCQSCGALTWPGERMSCCYDRGHAGAQLYSEHRLKFLNDDATWPVCQECDNGDPSEILRDLDEEVVEISEGRSDAPTRVKGSQAEVDMQQQLGGTQHDHMDDGDVPKGPKVPEGPTESVSGSLILETGGK